jgi:hypothetical protein
MWKKLDSKDLAVNLALLNYLTREFRAASRMGPMRGDIRIYASSEGFLFNDGAVDKFVILRGTIIAGIVPIEAPDETLIAGYTLVLSNQPLRAVAGTLARDGGA